MDSKSRLKEAIFATTHQIDAYGGFQLTQEQLADFATDIKSKGRNSPFNHDPTDPIQMEVVNAGVRLREDGEHEGWFSFLISDEDWVDLERRWAEAGVPGGYSITVIEPLTERSEEDIFLELSADAANWCREDLEIAFGFRPITGSIQINYLYQFALVPVAQVALQIVETVSLGVVANLLTYLLLKAKTKPIFASVTIKSKKHKTKLVFKASSQKSIDKMVAQLPDLVKGVEREINLGDLDEQ
jgi:hypothetical protein